jgi:hypothetical protein
MAEAGTNKDVVGSSDLTTFNIIAASCLIAIGCLCLFYLIPFHVAIREGVEQGLSARFMPRVAILSVLVLSIALIAGIVIRRTRGLGAIAEDNEDNEIQGFGKRELTNAVLLAAGSAVYVVLLHVFGFLIATPLTLAACMWFGKFRNPFWLLGLSIGFPIFLQQVLWKALFITLPAGIF